MALSFPPPSLNRGTDARGLGLNYLRLLHLPFHRWLNLSGSLSRFSCRFYRTNPIERLRQSACYHLDLSSDQRSTEHSISDKLHVVPGEREERLLVCFGFGEEECSIYPEDIIRACDDFAELPVLINVGGFQTVPRDFVFLRSLAQYISTSPCPHLRQVLDDAHRQQAGLRKVMIDCDMLAGL